MALEQSEQKPTSYSIRLTEAERQLVFQAAEAKGWTPTSLIKQATLERAAGIVNLSKASRFDFETLAREVAKLLSAPDILHCDESSPLATAKSSVNSNLEVGEYYTTDPPPFENGRLSLLRQAARLGGTEFFDRVLAECSRLGFHNLSEQLPDPIDPTKLSTDE